MDKKTLIGLALIGVILIAFTWHGNRQQAEYNRQKAVVDSINASIASARIEAAEQEIIAQPGDSAAVAAAGETARERHLGSTLYRASTGEEQFYTLENDVMRLVFSNRGGRVATVELKNYRRYGGDPLVLFAQNSSLFDLSFFIKHNFNQVQINTSEYFFTPLDPAQSMTFAEGEAEKKFVMRLNMDTLSYVDYIYTVKRDDHMVDFDVRFVGMEQLLAANQNQLDLVWRTTTFQNEKGFENENNATTISYKFPGESSIENLGFSKESKSDRINSRIKWVAGKQQFFSSILVAADDFQNGDLEFTTHQPGADSMKTFHTRLSVGMSTQTSDYKFQFYFGPNRFSILKTYGLHFERLIPLGGWIIGWINRWVIIPVFDILGQWISSFGLIILLLTVIIKILIAPLTYKSYLSQARMRLLKPEVDEIGKRYPKPEDAMKKQQATMALYKSAGVNPMGGCLPMLIQFPILIAMFRFFPASIELRGQSFLWADDLSSYDSILQLPFTIPFYGSHVSLFTLLMAISVFISSKISYNQTASAGPQMAGMKFMMLYMMPVMLLLWFNNYASGLSYYYLVSNIFTIGQTYAFRYAVSDEKLHRQMKENAKKPVKKSKWAERYDQILKQQQQQAKAASAKKKK